MKNNILKISSVLKHHDLIQIHSSLGANEQKIFNFIIFCIRYKRAKNGCINTSHSEINKFVGKKLNSLQLQDNFRKMMEVVVQIGLLKYFPKNKKKIANKKKWGLRHLVEKVDYDNGEIKIFLPSELVEMVLNYGQEYCMLNFQTINKFNSKYTIRLYENIMRYITPRNKYIQLPKMELSLFKRLLGITSQYKRLSHLKQKVIQVAVDEINQNTNIKVSYELFKSGTKYTHIKIYAYFKTEQRLIENTLTLFNKDINVFLHKYLPLYANKEVVAFMDNNEIYFEKKSMKFIMRDLRGASTLNHDTSIEVLNYCYENREGFDWFNELDFEQLLYESREKDRKDYYAEIQDNMIYSK